MLITYLNPNKLRFVDEIAEDKAIEFFLKESNAIEGVYDEQSLTDAKKAWEFISKQEELNGGILQKTHKILMRNQPLEPGQKGHWRKCKVWIAGKEGAPHVAIAKLIPECLRRINAVDLIAENSPSTLEQYIINNHIEYENIHPFVDGNGRTGRMLMNWERLKAGLPLLVIEENRKQLYYEWFKRSV